MKYTDNIAPEIHNELQAISEYVSEKAENNAVGERVVKTKTSRFFN